MTLDPQNDEEKNSFKTISPVDAIAEANYRANNNMPGVKILALKDDNDNILESFIHDEQPMPEVFDALKMLAETLFEAQFGMRHEFNREAG